MVAYSIFTNNHKNPKVTKISFIGEWVNKLGHIHTIEYIRGRGENKLSNHTKTQMNLKYIFLSNRRQSEIFIYYLVAFI